MNRKMAQRINIVGASGSGTTTLGRTLSEQLEYAFFDADDFFWKPTTAPFTEKADAALRLAGLLNAMASVPASVVSGSLCGWGAGLEDSFDLVIFLTLPAALRIERIEARDTRLYGRCNSEFVAWAAQYEEGRLPGRSRARHEAWLESRSCPVMRFDGDEPIEHRIELIVERLSNEATYRGEDGDFRA
jgi:adenylate kinase family enzyme